MTINMNCGLAKSIFIPVTLYENIKAKQPHAKNKADFSVQKPAKQLKKS